MTFWGFVIWSNVAVCVAQFIVVFYYVVQVVERFRQTYPDFISPKTSVINTIATIGYVAVIGLIPIFNLIVLFMLIAHVGEYADTAFETLKTRYGLSNARDDAQDGVV